MKTSLKLPAFSGRCRPAHFVKDAKDQAALALLRAGERRTRSVRADRLLLALAVLLLLAGLSNCTAARPAREAHATRAEQPRPSHFAWYESDSITD